MIIDSHCHLHFDSFKSDRDQVIASCIEHGVIINTVGTHSGTSKRAVELAEKNENMYATIGLHPTHVFPMEVHGDEYDFISKAETFDEAYYDTLAQSEKVIAVGECGIDLFHLPENKSTEEVLEKQKEVFLKQVDFANKYNLPLVIHVRDAHEQLIQILKSEVRSPKSAVVHCYTSNWGNAGKYLDMGFYLGFTGVITFPPKKTDPKSQEDLIEVVKKCPLNRMLIETDAPYLAPQAYRGQRCEPWMVEDVIKKIAEIRGKTLDEIKNILYQNTLNLFTRMKLK